jgi:hypothetical protein
VKDIELGTSTSQLKNKSAKIVELEKQDKSREVLLSKLNANKDKSLNELDKLHSEFTGRSSLKEAKHVI